MFHKLFITFFTILLTTMGLTATTVTIDGLTYDLGNTTAKLYAGNSPYIGEVVIPESITYKGRTYSVTDISSYAFRNCSQLTSVTIPNTIDFIPSESFKGCTSLKTFIVEDGDQTLWFGIGPIDTYNFSDIDIMNDSPLENVYIGRSVYAPYWVYNNQKISYDGQTWFYYPDHECQHPFDKSTIRKIEIGKNVKSIDGVFGKNVTSAKVHISDMEAWCRIKFNGNPLTYAHHLYLNDVLVTHVDVPNGIKTLDATFHGCTDLESVSLPSSLNTISNNTFSGCINLKSIDIPNSVTVLGAYSFANCESLKTVKIPNSVTEIGDEAFEYCKELTTIEIPNSVTVLGAYSFRHCESLKTIKIPYSVTEIGEGAFAYCKELTTIEIPNSINEQKLNRRIFEGCSNMEQLTIPFSVSSIGSDIIDDCLNLRDVWVYSQKLSGNDWKWVNGLEDVTIHSWGNYKEYADANNFAGKWENLKDLVEVEVKEIALAYIKLSVKNPQKIIASGRVELNGESYPIQTQTSDVQTIAFEHPYLPEGIATCSLEYNYEGNGQAVMSKSIKLPPLLKNWNIVDKKQSEISVQITPHPSIGNDNIKCGVMVGGDFYAENKTQPGQITAKPLCPGSDYRVYPIIEIDGERYYKIDNDTIVYTQCRTNAWRVYLKTEVAPTSIILSGTRDEGDANDYIDRHGFYLSYCNDSRYDDLDPEEIIEYNKDLYGEYAAASDSRVELVGFYPGSKLWATYNASAGEMQFAWKGEHVVLPEIEFETMDAKAVSNDCAIICATTNLSDLETNTGFEWRRTDAPEVVRSSSVPCFVNSGQMSGKLKGLSANTYYMYRPYWEDKNGERTYGEWVGFGTADAYVYFEPTVQTHAPKKVTETTATFMAYAIDGSDDVLEQGFEYWPIVKGLTKVEHTRVVSSGQRMTATVTDLSPATTYHVRAFAETAKKTTYGEEIEFVTPGEYNSIEEFSNADSQPQSFDIYNLSGICVRRNVNSTAGLRPGVYIANGKKIVIL